MAFITVVSTAHAVKVDFGIYGGMSVSTGIVPAKRAFPIAEIVFSLTPAGFIEAATTYNSLTFPVSFDGSQGTFRVQSVNGVIPTSNLHLYDILVDMLG